MKFRINIQQVLSSIFFLYKNLLILVDFEVESHATSILQQGNINQEVGLITNPDIKILID